MTTKFTPPATLPAPSPKRVDIKAGKISLEGKSCVSDPRRGILSIVLGVEGRLRLQWSVRSGLGSRVEDDVTTSNTAKLEKIPGPSTARIVRIKIRDRPYLYWLQEPEVAADDEKIAAFNAVIAEAPSHVVGAENLARDLDAVLGRPRAEELPGTSTDTKRPFSSVGGAGQSAARSGSSVAASGESMPTPGGAGGSGELSAALQNALSSIGRVGTGAPPQNRIVPTPLHTFATPQRMAELLNDESAVTELRDFMPPNQTSVEDIREAIHSPQLSAAMRTLTQAIYSDQLPLLLSSLGLDAAAAATTNDPMEALVVALEKKYRQDEAKADDSGEPMETGGENGAPPC